MGFLPLVQGAAQELDLNTVELFNRFFSMRELIQLHIADLSVGQLALLKAALLQELAKQIDDNDGLREAVKNQVKRVADMMHEDSAE